MFEEAEPEFQTMAFFKTKIALRNALQVGMGVFRIKVLLHYLSAIKGELSHFFSVWHE